MYSNSLLSFLEINSIRNVDTAKVSESPSLQRVEVIMIDSAMEGRDQR
jgi:hypothetical protein